MKDDSKSCEFFTDSVQGDEKKLVKAPLLKGMDFNSDECRKNPLLHIRLYVGHSCNLKCVYCSTDAKKSNVRHSQFLSVGAKLDLLKKIRDDFGTKTVFINGRGEPTLDQDFFPIVKGIFELGMTPFVATNGATLFDNDSAIWKLLYETGASVMLKMNSVSNKELEADVFGLSPDSEEYKNIRCITETGEGMDWVKKFARDRRLAMNCVLCKATAEDDGAPAVLRFCRENGIIPWFNWLLMFGRATRDMVVSEKAKKPLMKKLTEIDAEYGYERKASRTGNFGIPSELEEYWFHITNTGRIYSSKYNGGKSFSISNFGKNPDLRGAFYQLNQKVY
ncbi:MAG: radical SAM protein [Alphaproteobacteria bacterium]|nr:radical SAM protein [Alphaproteobacteria bacterium]